MTDSNPQVSGEAENEGVPTPKFSDVPDSSTSVGADDALVSKVVSRLKAELVPELTKLAERQAQSVKDKRFSKIEKELGSLGLLADLEQQGVPIPAELKTEYRLRDMEARLTQPQPVPTGDPGRSQAAADAAAAALSEVTKYGLPTNDPALIEILRGSYRNPDAFNAAVRGYILDKKTQTTQPASPAGVIQSPVVGGTDTSPEKLKSDYIKDMQAARGKPAEIRAIKDRYIKQGVNIHDVDFS